MTTFAASPHPEGLPERVAYERGDLTLYADPEGAGLERAATIVNDLDVDELRWLMVVIPAALDFIAKAPVPSAEPEKVEAGQIAGQTTIDEVLD